MLTLYKRDLCTIVDHLEVCALFSTLRVFLVVMWMCKWRTNAIDATRTKTSNKHCNAIKDKATMHRSSLTSCACDDRMRALCLHCPEHYGVRTSVTITLPLLSLYTVRSLREEGAHALLLPTLL
jgi:hypothetical protein